MKRLITIPLLFTLAACATPQPKLTATGGQDTAQQAADVAYCEELVPAAGRNVAALSVGVGVLVGYFGAKKERARYAECLRQRGYQVAED